EALFLAKIVGVLDRRAQQLADRRRDSLLGKRQRIDRIFHAAALDQFQYQPGLLRRDPLEARLGSKFLFSKIHLLSPLSRRWRRRWLRRSFRSRRLYRVALEVASLAEFAELVPNHVLGDIHRNELATVMHRD